MSSGTGNGNGANNPGGNKRNYYHAKGHKTKYQPRRGGPGIILTCETGRDAKAKREGIEIIRYYYNLAKDQQQQQEAESGDGTGEEVKDPAATTETKTTATPDDTKKQEESAEKQTETGKSLSLEEELAQMKSENNNGNSGNGNNNQRGRRGGGNSGPFAVYDTGCKGTVFVMCTAPDCALIPKLAKFNKGEEATEEDKDGEPDAKKAKTEATEGKESEATTTTTVEKDDKEKDETEPSSPIIKWDPVAAVRSVMEDIDDECKNGNSSNKGIPGSRFVSRMIPMQATCFASMEEITATFRSLMDHIVLPSIEKKKNEKKDAPITFGIKFKKRNCGNVTRDKVIDAIAVAVDEATNESWTVNLKEPDYEVEVQVCKTLCGISIFNTSGDDAFMASRRFNVADLREAAHSAATSTGATTTTETTTETKKDDEDKDDK